VSGQLHAPDVLAPGTHWIGGWVGSRADLGDMKKKKFLTLPGLELRPLGRPARSQSLHRLRYPGSLINSTFFFNLCGGTLGTAATYWPTVPAPDDGWWWLWRYWWTEDWQGQPKYSEQTCPSATLSTTNPTWLDPGWTRAAAVIVQLMKWRHVVMKVMLHKLNDGATKSPQLMVCFILYNKILTMLREVVRRYSAVFTSSAST
jgi:hypothetical protein